MDEPDFSKYSKEQLQQILTRIDATRFPERVREIEARIAAFASAPAEVDPAVTASSVPTIAGFWRRTGAFCIDMVILGIVGICAGAFLHAQFAALGAWGRVVGFVITLIYFGVTESRLGDGQSLGMKVLGLRVISRTGEALSAPAAFIRAGIFCVAYFLQGAAFGVNEWVAIGISTLIFGLAFSICYMLIFNRKTRQSIHDLAVGAVVVKAGPGKISFSTESIWRGHAVIVGVAILALVGGGVLISRSLLQSEPLSSLVPVQRIVSMLPGVDRVSVNLNSFSSSSGTTHRLLISAFVDPSTANPEALAQRIAQIALENSPAANRQQSIAVTLISGYDIGIASSWSATTYAHTPEEWRVSLLPAHS